MKHTSLIITPSELLRLRCRSLACDCQERSMSGLDPRDEAKRYRIADEEEFYNSLAEFFQRLDTWITSHELEHSHNQKEISND